jgi:hypothetical protein
MKKAQDLILQLFGGAIICMMVISFLGFLFQMGSKLNEMFGIWGFIAIVALSYLSGWIFLRKLDQRVKENANPKMIHYNFNEIEKKERR